MGSYPQRHRHPEVRGNERHALAPVRFRQLGIAYYCAPWCGCMCTWEDHQQAKKGAARLVALLGDQWEAHVWENMGWHGEAVCGPARVTMDLGGGWHIGVWNVAGGVQARRTSRFREIPRLIRECLAECESQLAETSAKLDPVRQWADAPLQRKH